jgi:RNA polymerase sigma-70 factor (ECF subfamily)
VDLARRQDRRAAREQRVVAEADPPVIWFAGDWETQERARAIQTALAAVPADQREVIVLKTWAELTFAEIAEVLDIPANTAASRYRLGLEALREQLPARL